MRSLFPAYAGVIPIGKSSPGQEEAFPRIRGGDPSHNGKGAAAIDLFPAYAGVIPGGSSGIGTQGTFPRIRGGDPDSGIAPYAAKNFSPHTRG